MSATEGVDQTRNRARRRLPRVAFDFVDGGADDEVTLRRNRSAFDDLALIPRMLAGVGEVSTETELLGHRLRMPLLLAPAGGVMATGPDGYANAVAGAAAAGVVNVQAWLPRTVDGATENAKQQWYQLYLNRDRERLLATVRQVKSLGYSALVLTADVPVGGNRERDIRNGLTVPLRLLTPRIVADVIRRPRWLWQYLRSGEDRGATFERGIGKVREVQTLSEAIHEEFNPQQTWDDLRWVREIWDGPLLLKGVMCGEDTELAIEAGCEGVVVSNHGGRQLDGTPASIEVLPDVVAVAGDRAVVLLDGGVRRGTDLLKALALGAKACLVGRPWVFAVAVGGARGVAEMLQRFNEELIRDLQLIGAKSVADLDPGFVRRREGAAWMPIEPRAS